MANLDEYNIGVSQAGMDKIKTDIKLHLVTNAQAKLRARETVNSSITNIWSGTDCEVYIENIGSDVEKICTALDNYQTQIEAKLDEVYQSWVDFQLSNVKKN